MKSFSAFLFKPVIFLVVVFLSLPLAYGEIPRLFTTPDFTPADFAEAVNHFIALGEDGAVKELEQLASKGGNYHLYLVEDGKEGFYYPERVGWMCRALFEGQNGQALRPPKFGTLEYLPPPDLMTTNWPQFPIARSGSTYFVLWEGDVTVSGEIGLDDAKSYIEYCQKKRRLSPETGSCPNEKKSS
ncbi:MAG TPA: hypothetical protein VMH87_01005 [Pseudomonadales bacterium]|nr:hypothetical protein [Pseudomonadales bacterium]